MRRNMRMWMYGLLNASERQALPVLSFPGAQLRGLTVQEVVNSGEAQYECIKAIAQRYTLSAALTCMDLSVEAEAFGCGIRYAENEVPTIIKPVINELEEVDTLCVPTLPSGRTAEYIKAAAYAAAGIMDRPTFAGMIGPISLAGRLFNMSEAMVSILTEPDKMHELLSKCTRFLVEYAKMFKAAGANGIIIAEPAAGLLSAEHCQEFSARYVKEIVDAVQDDYFMVILHNCGHATHQVQALLSTGSRGYHFGNAVDMAQIMPQIPWGRIAFGNIDPAGVIKNGSVGEVRERTKGLLYQTAAYKNFVLSSGCDIPPGTPEENIVAFLEELDEFNRSQIRVIA